jgi:ribosomal protein L34E
MEPWQQEQLWQLQLERQAQKQPRCHCCEKPIQTDLYLDLSPFGLQALACERCVEEHMRATVS